MTDFIDDYQSAGLLPLFLLLLYLFLKVRYKAKLVLLFVCCAFNYVHRSSYELVQNGFQRHRSCDNPEVK
jgi:hypothetical protein